jgi:hypothetical protein
MNENKGHFTLYGKSPFLQLGVALLFAIVLGGAIFLVFFLGGLLISGFDLSSVSENLIADIGEKDINFFRFLMIMQSIAMLLIPAIIVRKMLLPEDQRSLNDLYMPELNEIVLVILLILCILPINGIAGEVNAGMKFPEWLSGLEEWMRLKEDEAAELVRLLIPSDSAGVMLINLFIIAILPAISEELFFRGVLQRIFYGFFRSPHTAIWFTSILFSAIHLQFYGFIPRLILGLSFGYLYYWGRTLWLPVIAHFVNNATAVAGEYFFGMGSNTSVVDTENWTKLLILPTYVFLSLVILLYFRNKFNKEQIPVAKVNASDDYGQV